MSDEPEFDFDDLEAIERYWRERLTPEELWIRRQVIQLMVEIYRYLEQF